MTFIEKRARDLGLRKVDANQSLKIEVTATDVARGSTKTPGNCALARACKRTYKVDNAYFFKTAAWLEHDGHLVRYAVPASLQKEIFAFDRSRAMEPGVYHLAKPGAARALDAHKTKPKLSRATRRSLVREEMAERVAAKRGPQREPRPRNTGGIRGYHSEPPQPKPL